MSLTVATSEAAQNIPVINAELTTSARKSRPANDLFDVARSPQDQAVYAVRAAQEETYGVLEQILASN